MNKSLIYNVIALALSVLFSLKGVNESCAQSFSSQDLMGAWRGNFSDSIGEVTGVAIVTDGYYSVCRFDEKGKRFLYTMGGKWSLDEKNLIETVEFNTLDSTEVGKVNSYEIDLSGDKLKFVSTGEEWERLDDMEPGKLGGAWLITGRERNGELSRRTPGARKTMKILSGTRFQWIAYNTDSGKFFGTGGGTYTTVEGKYVENIDFFSRNADRIGARLEFDFELKDKEWHHRGFSSSGNPMYEIWTPRSMLEE